MQCGKRISVLHEKRCVSVKKCGIYDIALYIPSVDIVVHKILVSARNTRLCNKAGYVHKFISAVNFHKILLNFPVIYIIYYLAKIAVSYSVKFCLAIHYKSE